MRELNPRSAAPPTESLRQDKIPFSEHGPTNLAPPTGEVDYTQDWRHIYLAANNLFAGMLFTLFVFILFIQMF